MDDDLEKNYQRMNEDFDYLLERFRKFNELIEHYQNFSNIKPCGNIFLYEETLLHIILENLVSNIEYCQRKRDIHKDDLYDIYIEKE